MVFKFIDGSIWKAENPLTTLHILFLITIFYWNPINNYRYNQTCYGVGCHKVSVLVMVNYVLLQLIAKMRRTHILIEQRNGYWRSTERAVCAREKHVTTNPGLPGSTLFLQFLVKYSTVQYKSLDPPLISLYFAWKMFAFMHPYNSLPLIFSSGLA